MKTADVAIIGGGIIGASIAFELAAEKLDVIVLDRQQPGLEASWAAAGMLSPGPDAPDALPLVPLAKESMRLYPAFVAAIEELSAKRAAFARNGTIEVFTSPHGEAERDKMVAEFRALGIAIESISLDTAREAEPALGPAARAAAWLPEEEREALADALGVSPAAAWRLVRGLKRRGALGVVARVGPAPETCECLTYIKVDWVQDVALQALDDWIAGDPAIISGARVTGNYDYRLESRHGSFQAANAWSRGLSHVTARLVPGSGHGMAIYFDVRDELLRFLRRALGVE